MIGVCQGPLTGPSRRYILPHMQTAAVSDLHYAFPRATQRMRGGGRRRKHLSWRTVRHKDYSFADGTSRVVRRELQLRETLTTDRHFRQTGGSVRPAKSRGDG
jgi:hypothetical protein